MPRHPSGGRFEIFELEVLLSSVFDASLVRVSCSQYNCDNAKENMNEAYMQGGEESFHDSGLDG